MLQFSPKIRIGDWFLSKYGTVIRVYGFVNQPYILSSFLKMRVFALELIRQKLIVEYEHFLSFKKISEITFPWTLGPSIIKRKSVIPVIGSMLGEMGFLVNASINYDPHHLISNRRHANKNKPFEHFEVAGLSEEASWMDYPKDIKNGGNMQEYSLSSAPENNSPQHDISSIVVAATQITPLASFFRKKNK